MFIELLFLGTGTSVGVPMIGCKCAVCRSRDPRNNRRRTSVYIRTPASAFVIDTPPDFRQQMLDFDIDRVDAVVFTHDHADHIFGFDDIRRFNTLSGRVIPAYGARETLAGVRRAFNYIDNKPSPQGFYRPLVEFIEVAKSFTIGDVLLTPLEVKHGDKMNGYLLELGGMRLGYVPDCCFMPQAAVEQLRGVDVMILDALRYRPHPAHFNIEQSLALLKEINPTAAYLIHLCHDVDHEELESSLPRGVYVSYDGLQLRLTPGGEGAELKCRELYP